MNGTSEGTTYLADNLLEWSQNAGNAVIGQVWFWIIVVGCVLAFAAWIVNRGGVAKPVGVLLATMLLAFWVKNATGSVDNFTDTVKSVNPAPAQVGAPAPGWVDRSGLGELAA